MNTSNVNYVALALANEEWQDIEASFALEGMSMTDEDRGRAGRVIAGVITTEQALEEVKQAHLATAS